MIKYFILTYYGANDFGSEYLYLMKWHELIPNTRYLCQVIDNTLINFVECDLLKI